MSKQEVVIFGTSKVAEIVYSCIKNDEMTSWKPVAFCVDKEYLSETEKFGLPVVSFESVDKKFNPLKYKMLIAMGYHKMNQVREKKREEAKKKGYELVSYIHSMADVSADAEIGENVIILNNATIGPFCKIGNNVCIYNNATVSHHVNIEDNVWITSGTVIGGNTEVGKNCFIGINSTIGHNTKIGANNFLGANCLVTKKTEDNSVYVMQDTPKYRLNTEQFMRLFKFD